MSIVGRKGKLSLQHDPESAQDVVWERIEDVLTADVFGAYRYLPLQYGLIPFLAHAKDENGRTLNEFLSARGTPPESLSYARVLFWPHFADGREPDLMVLLGSAPDRISAALLVEAKLYATQHEIESQGVLCSQIGYYLTQHLLGNYGAPIEPADVPDVRPLLFITRAKRIPVGDLRRARSEVRQLNPNISDSDVGLFWCSWRTAGEEARRLWHAHRHEVQERPWVRVLLDLWQDLSYRGLMPSDPFEAIPQPSTYRPAWRYAPRTGIEPIPVPPRPLAYRRRRPLLTPLGRRLPAALYAKQARGTPVIGGLPEIVYASRGLGIPSCSRVKNPWRLSYLWESENE